MLTDDGNSRPDRVDGLAEHPVQLMRHGDGGLFVGAGQDDDELVATDAPGNADWP